MINKWFTGCFRAAICLCVLVLFAVVLAGCNSGTLAETADEVRIRHTIDNRTKTQQIQDDLDGIFMMKEPGRLTEMYVR
ncbi:MAG: hypothetical protein J7M40_14890 [Planctomycetes bacterium]|nr:hypothetical protein [Planctomycetota bacterium]